MSRFETETAEAQAIVKSGQRLPRKECYFVPEAEYRRYQEMDAQAARAEEEKELNAWKNRILCVAGAAGRCGLGVMFLGAMADGLIVPGFAVALAVACAAWGVGHIVGRCRHVYPDA